MSDIIFKAGMADAKSFKNLRDSTGWGDISLATAQGAISASLGGMLAYKDGKLVGMARYIGDGHLNIYIQDVVISANMRGRGLGKAIVSRLITSLQAKYQQDCTIGIMAAKHQDTFYAPFGFIPRPSDVYGAGMIATLGDLKAQTS
jgi:predicted GNAT family N-acyltransferase